MHNRLSLIRKTLNLKKVDIAKEIGLASSSYCDIENGKATITERTIISICAKFNVNEEWLRYGTGEMFNLLDKKYDEFFEIYSKLSPPLQNFLITIAKELLKTQNQL